MSNKRRFLFLCLLFYNAATTVGSGSCGESMSNSASGHDSALCEQILGDERTYRQTFYTSIQGSVTAFISGTLSSCSSFIIMFLITRRSVPGLSTVYHRIMFGMSLADFFSSIAFAANTLPVPADTIYEQFEGLIIGNEFTCSAQGFMVLFGIMWQMNYSAALSLYYLFAIRYKMSDADLRKCIEPTLHLVAFLIAVPVPMVAFCLKLFHPTPFEAWCALDSIPWYCDVKDFTDVCTISGADNYTYYILYWIVFMHAFVVLSVTVASMFLIIQYVYMQEQYIKAVIKRMYGRSRLGDNEENRLASTRRRHNFTKVLSVQAAAYIITFLLVPMSALVHQHQDSHDQSWSLQCFHVLARPLQGFLSLLIFVAHKAYDIRRIQPQITVREAIKKVLVDREEPRYLMSGISLVRVNESDSDGAEFDFYFEGVDEEGTEEVELVDNDDPPEQVQDQVQHDINLDDENDTSPSRQGINLNDASTFIDMQDSRNDVPMSPSDGDESSRLTLSGFSCINSHEDEDKVSRNGGEGGASVTLSSNAEDEQGSCHGHQSEMMLSSTDLSNAYSTNLVEDSRNRKNASGDTRSPGSSFNFMESDPSLGRSGGSLSLDDSISFAISNVDVSLDGIIQEKTESKENTKRKPFGNLRKKRMLRGG